MIVSGIDHVGHVFPVGFNEVDSLEGILVAIDGLYGLRGFTFNGLDCFSDAGLLLDDLELLWGHFGCFFITNERLIGALGCVETSKLFLEKNSVV